MGGGDVVRELHETGKLREELGLTEVNLDDRLRELINQEKVMLFRKGNPQAPRCGFSTRIVDVLNENGIKYGSFDILSDDDVRQGLLCIHFLLRVRLTGSDGLTDSPRPHPASCGISIQGSRSCQIGQRTHSFTQKVSSSEGLI